MIKNIVFDFGGVLFDLSWKQAVRRFKAIGLADAEQRLDRFHQRGIFEQLESGLLSTDDFLQELGQLCHRSLSYDEVLHAWLGYVGAPMDEAKLNTLDQLRAEGYRTFLLSNTNPFVQAWAEGRDFCLSHRPLSSYLEKCYTSYEVRIMKPDPAIFQFMLRDADILPDETIFLDDSPANIAAAESQGIHTLLVEKNGSWESSLREAIRSFE